VARSGPLLFQPLVRNSKTARALITLTVLMTIAGVIFVASATEGLGGSSGSLFSQDVMYDVVYAGFGFLMMYAMMRIRLPLLLKYSGWFVLGSMFLVLYAKVAGPIINGARRWIVFGSLSFQPSEFVKFSVILYVAWFLSRASKELGDWRKLFLFTLPILGSLGIIVLQPDIGTASVVAFIVLVMLSVAGLPNRMLGTIVAMGVVSLIGYSQLKRYSWERFISFLHPNQGLSGVNYQLMQAKIAFGSGGLKGVGYGNSPAKWGFLPNPHTDFIFTIIGQEMGFVGVVVIIAAFAGLLMLSVSIARNASNQVYSIMAIGIATWIGVEAVINMASVLGLWAVTGIPLPFFSYGGSALVVNLMAMGILYNISNDNTHSQDVTIRRGTHQRPAQRRPAYDLYDAPRTTTSR
jgi:cell division protein FtsW (lipid II flippase)